MRLVPSTLTPLLVATGVGLSPGSGVTAPDSERAPAVAEDVEQRGHDESDASSPDASPEEPMVTVVTARRAEEALWATPRAVDVVTDDDMRRDQARALPEALKRAKGLVVQETNRGAGAPIIRGLVGPSNLIVIDGVRFNTSTFRTGPNQYLATIDPYAIGQIEVIRGPSSVLYGNGAMGGVMQLVTKKPNYAPDQTMEVAGWVQSADQAQGVWVSLLEGSERWALLLGGSAADNGTLRAGGGYRQPLSDYSQAHWHGKLVYLLTPALKFTGAYLGTALRDAGRTDRLGQGDIRFYNNDDHFAYARLDWVGADVLERFSGTVSLHRTNERIGRFNCTTDGDRVVVDRPACVRRDLDVLTRKRVNEDDVLSLGFDINSRLRLAPEVVSLTVGAEGYFDRVGSSLRDARSSNAFAVVRQPRGNFSDDSTYRSFGVFVHAESTLWDWRGDRGKLIITGGSRVSHFGARADDVPGLGTVKYDFTGAVGTAGLQAILAERTQVYASFVQGFRAPNLQETTVLGDTGSKFEIPNANLSPERSDTIEAGAKASLGMFDARVAGFRSNLADVIDEEDATFEGQAEVDGNPVVRRVNAAKGTYHGVEGEASATWWRFRASSGITWTRGRVTRADGERTPARRIPPLFGSARIRYAEPDAQAYIEFFVNWAGRRDRLHPSDARDLRICETSVHSGALRDDCRGTPGWATLNLQAGWRFSDNTDLALSLLNLGDNRYRVHGSGFDAAGFDARTTLTVRY